MSPLVAANDGPGDKHRRLWPTVIEDCGTYLLEEATKSFCQPEWVTFLWTSEFHHIEKHGVISAAGVALLGDAQFWVFVGVINTDRRGACGRGTH